MTSQSKFEQMLEHLINEDQEKAKELFHQLVIEKSREIYENILAEEFEVNEADDEEKDDEEKDDEEKDDADDEGPVGGDETDDFIDDVEDDDMGDMGDDMDDMGDDEGDLENRVVDLEDALDELKAEFEELMGQEGDMGDDMGMDDMGDMGDMGDDMGMDDMGDEEGMDDMGDMGDMGDEEDMDDEFGMKKSLEDDFDFNLMREYVEKIAAPKHGDDGDKSAKSLFNKKKYNDMGGTASNIVSGGEASGEGTKGGLLNPSSKEENFGNVNVPGGNAGKTAFKHRVPGHGAEKKGTGDMGDKGAGSPLNGAPGRAK